MRENPSMVVLSVVVPVREGAGVLPRALEALEASDLDRERWESIVVVDGGSVETLEIARAGADRVVSSPAPARGPAYARNRGVEVARGEIVVFVDADVCVHPDALRAFLDAFDAAPDVGAVFGAYDLDPPAPGLVSQYRNLLHHYTHSISAGEAETFWAGCGAVRKRVFVEAGGFDAERYTRPQVEDIDLGHRIRDLGYRILLRPHIRGTHLKRWTLVGGMVTDVRDRGLPWMELLATSGGSTARRTALNLRVGEKVLTAMTAFAMLALLVGIVTSEALWLWTAGGLILAVVAGNLPLLGWFARRRGVGFALRVIPLRVLYYLLGVVSVGLGLARRTLPRGGHRLRPAVRMPAAGGPAATTSGKL